MTNLHPTPFALAMVADEGGPSLPVVVRQGRAVRLDRLFDAGHRWPASLPPPADLFALVQCWDAALAELCAAVEMRFDAAEGFDASSARMLAPMPQARQVICIGANYRRHVIDLVAAQGAGAASEGQSREERIAAATLRVDERARNGIPYAFPKLVSSITGPQDDIVIPRDAEQFDWELELGVVIGRPCWRVPREQALAHVAGYMVVNDLTRRELVYRSDMKSLGSDWLRAKSGPGFLPTGPWLVPAAFVDPHDLRLRLALNGQVMQDESTSDMLFDVPAQLAYVSSYARLLPGDLLATGSPAGNGMHHGRFLKPGDVITASIDGLGTQVNRCVGEPQ